MFSNLVKLLFGSEAKQDIPVDPAVDIANVQELGDSFLDADCISSVAIEDEDKENSHGLVDFETNEDDDWLLVSVSPPENGVQPGSEKNLSSSPASEPSVDIIRQKQLRETQILSNTQRLVQEWAREEGWERSSKDSATSYLCQMQDCSGTTFYGPELPTIVSIEADSVTPLEGIISTVVPQAKVCTQCYVPRHFHQAGSMQIWTSESNGSKYVRFMLERNKRRKHLKLCTNQPAHPSVEATEVPQTFESHQPTLPSKADLLDYIKSVKPQQKARELNVRKYLASSQIKRQNKVILYEGKAKNNRRKDLWRCHSGANNNRKCC